MNLHLKLSFRKPKVRQTVGFNVVRDWKIIIASFFLLVIIIAWFGWFLYSKTWNNEPDDKTLGRKEEIFNRGLLTETVEFYKEKSGAFERLKYQPTGVIDPSL